MTVERIVRPFQDSPVTPPLIVRGGTEFAPPIAVVFAAKDGAKTFPWSLSVSTESTVTTEKYRETSRKSDRVKIRNPDDPNQFVEVDRVRQMKLASESDPKLTRQYSFKPD